MLKQKKTVLLFISLFMVFILASCRDEEPSRLSDTLKLELEYDNLSYIDDGIGVATLASCEDGDTAEFNVDDNRIRVRFLGVDTPEASYKYEPWGLQATQYACEKLTEADEIVLERDWDGTLQEQNGRYLAFIWVDGKLLNLMLIEDSYSRATGVLSLKYGETMFDAGIEAAEEQKRINGETDPLFDYSSEGEEITLETLVLNPDNYRLKRVSVEGVVTARKGNHFFIKQGDYGIYVNAGYTDNSNVVEIGDYIELSDVQALYDLDRYGGLYIGDYTNRKVTIVSEDNEILPKETTIDALTDRVNGLLVELNDLEIIEIISISDYYYQLIVEDDLGNQLIVEHPEDAYLSNRVPIETFEVGQIIDVIGPLSQTPNGFKQYITHADKIINK
ncbi:MAG: thermonuclease family protein [Candidatus Izemoplasmataceae bacterium]